MALNYKLKEVTTENFHRLYYLYEKKKNEDISLKKNEKGQRKCA